MIRKLKEKITAQGGLAQFIRYLFVGGSSVLVDFCIFQGILFVLGTQEDFVFSAFSIRPEKAANAVAVVAGFLYSFILNRTWAFRSKENPVRQFVLMLILLAVNTVITSEAISLMGRGMGIPFPIAKITMQLAVAFWNYVIYAKIIYRS